MEEIKKALRIKDFPLALRLISKNCARESNPNALYSLAKLIETLPMEVLSKEFLAEQGFLQKKIAILGGYTTSFLNSPLKAALFAKGILAEIFEAPYGMFENAIYERNNELAAFRPDILYFCVGSEHLQLTSITVSEEIQRWKNLWKATHDFLGCDILQNTFEEPLHRSWGNFSLKRQDSELRQIQSLNLALGNEAPNYVHFLDVEAMAASVGRSRWKDEKLYATSKAPVAYAYLPLYVQQLSGVIAALYGKNKKCLVLDLDNTLWGGILGEEGPQGIAIGQETALGVAYYHFQNYIKSLKNRGVILAVCSKNEFEIAKNAFQQREMPLKWEDFSAFIANWEPKSDNLLRISTELNIGLDTLVFVDDNPAEREIVRRTLPQVEVIDLPAEPSAYTLSLSSSTFFETVAVSEEDLNRTQQYTEQKIRKEAQCQVTDYPSYLKSLEMVGTVAPIDRENLGRITQLVNKTNQFNLTTKRYRESEILQITQQETCVNFYVKLKDKFGDNGLISVLWGIHNANNEFTIETWLMSCRVLKRGVEEALFQKLIRRLQDTGTLLIKGTYIPTAKNKLVENFYSSLGFKLKESLSTGETHWEFDLSDHTAVNAALAKPCYLTLNLTDNTTN